jgi:hypothetical protein
MLQTVIIWVSVVVNSVLIILGICFAIKVKPNVVRYARWIYWFGVANTMLCCVVAFVNTINATEEELFMSIFAWAFSLLGIMLCAIYLNYKIEIDGEYLNYRGEFGKKHRFPIKDIYVEHWNHWIMLLACNNKRFSITRYSVHGEKLYELIKNNKNTNYFVRIHKAIAWLSAFGGAVCIALLGIILYNMITDVNFVEEGELLDYAIIMSVILAFMIFCIGVIVRVINFEIELREHTFLYRTAFGRTYEIPYKDVKVKRSLSGKLLIKYGKQRFYAPVIAQNFYAFQSKFEDQY